MIKYGTLVETEGDAVIDDELLVEDALWSKPHLVEVPPKRSFVPTVGFEYGEKSIDPFLERTISFGSISIRPRISPLERSAEDVARRFEELRRRWDVETIFSSSLDDLIYHTDFQKIIALGPAVVPKVLQRLADHPVPWLYALHLLVDDDPAKGVQDVNEAVEAWRRWGQTRGLIAWP